MEKEINEYKIYYTNSTGVELTNVDVNLCVNYKDNNNIEKLCKVIFSPEQAKLTMLMLEKAIEQFEKSTRPIEVDISKIVSSKGEKLNGGEE